MKSKYVKPTPETYITAGGRKAVKGGKSGPRSDQDRRELMLPQAQSIVMKFGGPRELARTLKACSDDPQDHYNASTIYRWLYPRSKGGTGGEIPLAALQVILRCARVAGVILSTDDIYPHMVGTDRG